MSQATSSAPLSDSSSTEDIADVLVSWVLTPRRLGHVISPVTVSQTSLIGSDSSCDVVLDRLGVAQEHARLVVSDGVLTIESFDPLTWLNDMPPENREIQDGDRLTIGPVELTVERVERTGDQPANGGETGDNTADEPKSVEVAASSVAEDRAAEEVPTATEDVAPHGGPAGEDHASTDNAVPSVAADEEQVEIIPETLEIARNPAEAIDELQAAVDQELHAEAVVDGTVLAEDADPKELAKIIEVEQNSHGYDAIVPAAEPSSPVTGYVLDNAEVARYRELTNELQLSLVAAAGNSLASHRARMAELDARREEIESVRASIRAREEAIAEREREIAVHKSSVDEIRADLERRERAVAERDERLSQTRESVAKRDAELEARGQSLEVRLEEVAKREREWQSKLSEVQSRLLEADRIRAEAAEARQYAARDRSASDVMLAEAEATAARASEVENERRELEDLRASLEQEREAVERLKTEGEAELRQAEEVAQDAAAEREQLSKRREELDREETSLRERMDQFEARSLAADSDLEAQREVLEQRESRIEELESEVTKLRNEVEHAEASSQLAPELGPDSELAQELDDRARHLSEREEKVELEQSELRERAEELRAREEELELARRDLEETRNSVDEARAEADVAAEDLAELEAERAALAGERAAFDAAREDFETERAEWARTRSNDTATEEESDTPLVEETVTAESRTEDSESSDVEETSVVTDANDAANALQAETSITTEAASETTIDVSEEADSDLSEPLPDTLGAEPTTDTGLAETAKSLGIDLSDLEGLTSSSNDDGGLSAAGPVSDAGSVDDADGSETPAEATPPAIAPSLDADFFGIGSEKDVPMPQDLLPPDAETPNTDDISLSPWDVATNGDLLAPPDQELPEDPLANAQEGGAFDPGGVGAEESDFGELNAGSLLDQFAADNGDPSDGLSSDARANEDGLPSGSLLDAIGGGEAPAPSEPSGEGLRSQLAEMLGMSTEELSAAASETSVDPSEAIPENLFVEEPEEASSSLLDAFGTDEPVSFLPESADPVEDTPELPAPELPSATSLGADMPAAPADAIPSLVPPPVPEEPEAESAPPVAPEPPPVEAMPKALDAVSDDDPVAAYMERLLARSRGDSESEEVVVPLTPTVQEAQSETPSETEPTPRPQKERREIDKEKIRQEVVSLRELALMSSRSAVAASRVKEAKMDLISKGVVVAVGVVVSLVLFASPFWSKVSYVPYGGLCLFITAGLGYLLSMSMDEYRAIEKLEMQGDLDDENDGPAAVAVIEEEASTAPTLDETDTQDS